MLLDRQVASCQPDFLSPLESAQSPHPHTPPYFLLCAALQSFFFQLKMSQNCCAYVFFDVSNMGLGVNT